MTNDTPKRIEALAKVAEEHGWTVIPDHDMRGGDRYLFCAERWLDGDHELGFCVQFAFNEESRRWKCQKRPYAYINRAVRDEDGSQRDIDTVAERFWDAISHIEHWLARPDEVEQFDWVQEALRRNP